jgi:hypothetical protein
VPKKNVIKKSIGVSDSRLSFIKLLDYKISSHPDTPTSPETMSKSKAWTNLCQLLKTKDDRVVDEAYQVLIKNYPLMHDKQAAWDEIINSIEGPIEKHDYHIFINVLASLYPIVPDKSKAWANLCQMLKTKDEHVIDESYRALIKNYPLMLDKQAAWDEIINSIDRRVEGKAWKYLCLLLKTKDERVVDEAYQALINSYPNMPDKQVAWEEIIRSFDMFVEGHNYQRFINLLARLYPAVPDKVKSWDGFFSIMKRDLPGSSWNDENYKEIYDTIELFFSITPDKEKAWDDLFNLTQSINGGRGWRHLLDYLEDLLPKAADVQKAWTDLLYYIPKVYSTSGFHHREQPRIDSTVTRTFRFVPDYQTAWNDMYILTKHDNYKVVSVAREIIQCALYDFYCESEKDWVLEKKLEAKKALDNVARSKNDPEFTDLITNRSDCILPR